MLCKLFKLIVAILLGVCGALLGMLGLTYETKIKRSPADRARD
jgi:hypothetical protein